MIKYVEDSGLHISQQRVDPVHGGRKLQARWTLASQEDMCAPLKKPTRFERIRYNIYDKIPTSCMCGEVHPIWKYIKSTFVFIFGKPDGMAIFEYDVAARMSEHIRDEIDKEIIADLKKLMKKG